MRSVYATTTAPLDILCNIGGAPGIVRRSPLIDALHPEVARQREFYLQLRRTRQREAPPSSPKPGDIKEAVRSASDIAAATCVKVGLVASPAAATAKANAAHAAADATGKRQSSRHAAAATTATTTVRDSPAAKTGGAKAYRRSRSRWSAAVQLLVPSLSANSRPVPPGPNLSYPSPVLTRSGTAAVAKGPSVSPTTADGADATARVGRLTVRQVSTVMCRCSLREQGARGVGF